MAQISVPKENVAKIVKAIEDDGGKIIKSHLSANHKEVVIIFNEGVKAAEEKKISEIANLPAGRVLNKPDEPQPLITTTAPTILDTK